MILIGYDLFLYPRLFIIFLGVSKLKILILAHQIKAGGGKVTCINILDALLAIDNNNEYFLVVPDHEDYHVLNLEERVSEVRYYKQRLGYIDRFVFDLYTRHKYIDEFDPDLIWAMGGFGLIDPPTNQAVSIQNPYLMYDLDKITELDIVSRVKVSYQRQIFQKQLSNTDFVIFQTNTMKKRCKNRYNYRGNTLVTFKGVSKFIDQGNRQVPKRLRSYQEKFKLFYLTRYYPHKGIEALIEMMDKYREELSDTILIITIEANQHKNAAKVIHDIRKRGLSDRVINVGYLQQSELAGYYRNCDSLIMPSRLESFSGTYLEAMKFGLPILTSDLDFAREICGDSAEYFNPWDLKSIFHKVQKVKNNTALSDQLVRKGKERLSNKFDISWKDIAIDILSAFEKL